MIDVFISHPSPFNTTQKDFLALIEESLNSHGLNPVNLGKNSWDFRSPLKPIKEIMSRCKAAIIIGLERDHCYIGYEKESSEDEKEYVHKFRSSSWIQIEAGMAYQTGLPLLILKEKKLYPDGILDPLNSDYFVFEFELEKIKETLSKELEEIILSWVNHIKTSNQK
jgi:hypothetical protein